MHYSLKNYGSHMINRLKHGRVGSSPRCRTRGDIVPRPPDSGRYVTTRSATRAATNSPMYYYVHIKQPIVN